MIAPVMCSGNGPSHIKEAAAEVVSRVELFDAKSQFSRPDEKHAPLELEWSNLRIDCLLGSGSFSQVYKAKIKKLTKHLGEKEERMFALKKLGTDTICCNESFVTGAVDLALEARILSKLHHENIIEMYGVKGGDIGESFSNSQSGGGFFIVMDLLEETLDHRLEDWRSKESKRGTTFKAFFMRKKHCEKRLQAIADRISDSMLGVVHGMEYIHSKNIILRDLKPHNIGIDKNGKVRIFDFGLARELPPKGDTTDLPRCNTGVAGTLRYISPENALGQPCGLSSDVYSFAILLFEVITLQIPFSDIKLVTDFKDKVIRGRHRPDLKFVPSSLIQDMLSDCWSPNPNIRPTFGEIRCIMDEVISSSLLTQEGEWRKFVFKKTKPSSSCGHAHCTMKEHSVAGGSFRKAMSSSQHGKLGNGSHHHKHENCGKNEVEILREVLKQEKDAHKRAGMSGSFHGTFNDQTRSFMENISFNSNRSTRHNH